MTAAGLLLSTLSGILMAKSIRDFKPYGDYYEEHSWPEDPDNLQEHEEVAILLLGGRVFWAAATLLIACIFFR